jgi:cystathionine beta-synthase
MNYCENILQTIGNTPLVKLNRVTANLPCPVFAKVESFNPGNSIKDRMALKMIEVAEKTGKLKPGGTIIEGTSGNTGMGLAIAAVIKGYKCIFTTTDKQSKEKVDMLKAVGAEVIVCPTNVLPEDPKSYYSVSRRLSEEVPNSFYVNQYDNLANRLAHYEQTGPEIWEQTDGSITHLVVATGTGGTITGTAQYLKEKNPNIKVWAIDSYGSLLTKYFKTGEIDMGQVHPYITEGIGEDFVPQNYDMSVIDHFEQVTDKDGAVMARKITREEGIFVGYSAGSALAGLQQLRQELKPSDVVVVIFHDHGSRYVGKIYNDQWMMERGFMVARTVRDVVQSRKHLPLISIPSSSKVSEAVALMKKYEIEHIPVIDNQEIVGSISENTLFNILFDHPDIKNQSIGSIMQKPFPLVAYDAPIATLASYMNKENGAVLTKDDTGDYAIITKYDVIQSLSSH